MTQNVLEPSKFAMPAEMVGMPADTPVLLGLSGGADSVALLDLLARRREADGFRLLLAHVNHGIRGAEALRDRDFCVACAARYGLEIRVFEEDVPAYARQKCVGLEEAAREVRYECFARLMREEGIPLLVTAHHANDHMETLLFRLSRGTSLAGLGGISPTRPFENGFLARPLLPFSKETILSYCERNELDFVTDSTNADTAYARNRLRSEVTPVLETLFTGVAERAVTLSQGLREDEDCLSALADEALKNAENGTLCIASLQGLHRAVLKRVLKKWAFEACGALESVHVEALVHLAESCSREECVALPNAHYALVRNGRICLSREKPSAFESYRLPFAEGVTRVPETDISICVSRMNGTKKVHNLSVPVHTILTPGLDIITKDVYWRSRQAGDVILLRGMHRKLRRMYAAAGVPTDLRERIPLLCDGEGVLWAPLVGVRDGVEETPQGWKIEITWQD